VQLPDVDSLRCFVAAAEHLNFRAAARVVALTPAALGQRIRQLEDQLGAPLFVRTTRSVQLTEAGLSLLPRAQACLAEAAACVRAARGEEGAPPVDVTLGTRFELGMSWVVPALPRVAAAVPRATLHLFFGSGPEIVDRLRGGLIDCAVTSAKLGDPRLHAERLHQERYAFVATPRLLARRPLTRPDEATGHTLLDIDASLPLYHYFSAAPGAPALPRFGGHRWLGLGAAVKARVLAGEGVAVLPVYMIERELGRGRLRRLFPQVDLLTDYFKLVYRDRDPRRAIYRALAAELAQVPIC
jgi:LysR family glycine cleavage system transcriptional activator